MSEAELIVILLGWASHLSGYPLPAEPPKVRFEDHAFFVANVCGGKECNVAGWYNDSGVVYLDRAYADLEDGAAAGLAVHEFTHYLQHKSGAFDSESCADSVRREREAYYVQNRFNIEVLGRVTLIVPGPSVCRKGRD